MTTALYHNSRGGFNPAYLFVKYPENLRPVSWPTDDKAREAFREPSRGGAQSDFAGGGERYAQSVRNDDAWNCSEGVCGVQNEMARTADHTTQKCPEQVNPQGRDVRPASNSFTQRKGRWD